MPSNSFFFLLPNNHHRHTVLFPRQSRQCIWQRTASCFCPCSHSATSGASVVQDIGKIIVFLLFVDMGCPFSLSTILPITKSLIVPFLQSSNDKDHFQQRIAELLKENELLRFEISHQVHLTIHITSV